MSPQKTSTSSMKLNGCNDDIALLTNVNQKSRILIGDTNNIIYQFNQSIDVNRAKHSHILFNYIWFFQLQARCRTHVHFYVNKNRDHSFLLIDKYDTFNFNVTTFSRPVQHTFITLLHQIRSLPTHLEKITHFDECFFQFPISFFFSDH